MNRLMRCVFPFCFVVLLLLPGINDVFHIFTFEQKDEKRVFQHKPGIRLDALDVFPPQYDAYYNDHFSFRSPLLDLFHNIKFYAFRVPAHPEKVAIGRNNWYFEGGVAKKIYEGERELQDTQLTRFHQVWAERKTYFDSLHIPYYWVIAPMKHYIYEEYLPVNFVRSQTPTRGSRMLEAFRNHSPQFIIDPTAALLQAKDTLKMYYQLDNHWNLGAGYLVSQLIIDRIRQNFPQVELAPRASFNWEEREINDGNHKDALGIDELTEKDLFPGNRHEEAPEVEKYQFTPPAHFAEKDRYEKRYRKAGKGNGLRILVIMDSFGERIEPFIKESFDESVFIFDGWTYGLDKPLIETVKPDLVVYISFEKLLERMIGGSAD